MPSSISDPLSRGARDFCSTHWSVVLSARGDSEAARKALEKLCQAYWYPLYAFVRRQGYTVHDAQDSTQEFFARLLAKGWLGGVERERGKFRSWLLGSMKHFLANEWDRAHAIKRGGKHPHVSFDESSAEERYQLEPLDPAS